MSEAIVNQSAKEPKRRKRQPASEHQIAVNRANAAKSTGPSTPEGPPSSLRPLLQTLIRRIPALFEQHLAAIGVSGV